MNEDKKYYIKYWRKQSSPSPKTKKELEETLKWLRTDEKAGEVRDITIYEIEIKKIIYEPT